MPLDRLNTDPPETTRRSFHMAAICAIWGAITATLSVPALAYLFLPPKVRKDESWTDVGDVTYLTPNQPVEMAFRRNRVDGWKVVSEKLTAWVVMDSSGKMSAFGPQCTHLGCAHHWDDAKSQFVCPCHNSLFAIDGTVAFGPAPRPLDHYETKLEGSKLLVGDLRRPEGTGV